MNFRRFLWLFLILWWTFLAGLLVGRSQLLAAAFAAGIAVLASVVFGGFQRGFSKGR
jgi:hypothetical protein